MREFLYKLTQLILDGGEISRQQALELLEIDGQPDVFVLLNSANVIRQRFRGNTISLCSVINAKSGACSQDCKFCSQSVHYNADIEKFPLRKSKDIVNGAKKAKSMGAARYGIVVSGKGVQSKRELEEICDAIRDISKGVDITRCASLGTLNKEAAYLLKEAGLQSYHHNLETSESFFPKICTTHTYKERLNTVKTAKETGLEVCCGGIFGLGESNSERVEFAFALKELDVDMVPLNFLNPIEGTPMEDVAPLSPFEALKIIAMFRFVLSKKDIKVCGGREKTLGSFQPLMYLAGASGTMIGDYLTTKGRDWKEDIQEIKDLGLEPYAEFEKIVR